MQAIKLNNIKKEIADRVLFEIDSLIIKKTDRIGIVGRNGSGKSTLFLCVVKS